MRNALRLTREQYDLLNRKSRNKYGAQKIIEDGITPMRSTVSEPIIATPTTSIVAIEKDMNVLSRVRNILAIATITVNPEMRTERPDVAAAASSAARWLRPAARSSRSRFVLASRTSPCAWAGSTRSASGR